MKNIVDRLCGWSTARFAALALTLLASSGAWAARKPKALWFRDFENNVAHGGYTFSLNNAASGEGNSISDGVITIGSTSSDANGGVRFMSSSTRGKVLTVVARMKMKSGTSQDASNTPVLYSYRNSNGENRLGVVLNTSGKMAAAWNLSEQSGASSQTVTFSDSSWDFTAARFRSDRPTGSDQEGEDGTTGYFNGEQYAYNRACRNNDYELYGVTLGGAYNAKNRNFYNLQTDYVVIFESAEAAISSDISAWSLAGMTTVTTDINTTTTTDGVNLPASATLTASATPAAVFVQQTSTLTVTGSGSLNINSGNGPLYVADGTTLTIDATGITSLSGDGDSVTLVSGVIYDTDLISVKIPVVIGCKVTPTITESGITLTCAANSVTFTSPFTGSDLEAPTTATAYSNSADQISFGNDSRFEQTISGRSATVADVVGGSYSTAINGFLTTGQTATSANKDTYLRVSGVSARLVCGVQKCAWSSPGTYETTGDAITQIEGNGTYIQYVFGAGSEGGYNNVMPKVTGNTGVTVKGGAVITGSVVGGWGSSHTKEPEVTENTAVRIETVQGTDTADPLNYIPAGWIIGGSAYQTNSGGSKTKVSGNSSVTVALDSEATGTFSKNLLGASLLPDTVLQDAGGQKQTVSGNSSVAISAPADVTFSGMVVGGGYSGRPSSGGNSTVGGNSSVTIDGGTYTGTIVAGGYAPNGGNVSVSGTATMTLNGGVFSSATLKAGVASGTKSLVIGGDVSLPATAVNNSGFDGLSVNASKTLTLGTGRLVDATYPVLTAVGDGGKVAFQLTSAEETANHAVFIKCAVSDMSGKVTILDSNGVDVTSTAAASVAVRKDYLVYGDANAYTVTIGSGETAWDSVVWTLADSSETMATAASDVYAEGIITLDGGVLVISDAETFTGKLTVTGTGTLKFEGNATLTSSCDITIGSGVTLDFSGLTNLTNMGRGDTIISAVAITVSTSTVTFPSTWTCTYSTSASSLAIAGFNNNSDSVSINIIGGASSLDGKSIASDGIAGFYPVTGSQWNQIAQKTSTDAVNVTVDVSERLANGDVSQEAGMVATATANNAYTAKGGSPEGANADLMYGYLDDGGSGANITVKNIPYSQYSVFVYMGTDQTSDAKNFRPVTVNSTTYCGSGSATVAGSSNWGVYSWARGAVTLAEGSNYLRVDGLSSSTLTVQGSTGSDGYRCGIAGIQIVNTGTRYQPYVATLTGGDASLIPSGTSTGMTKTSAGAWVDDGTHNIVLTNPAEAVSSLSIGENVNASIFKIKGAGTVTLSIADGCALSISSGKIDLSSFSGTLRVDSTVTTSLTTSLFAGMTTNGGMVRFLGNNLEFDGATSLPVGNVAFNSATLKGSLGDTSRTVVVEDGDVVTIASSVDRTAFNFDVRGGSLTMEATSRFWFGIASSFTQTGGTVTYECTGTQTETGSSDCSIFGYSSSGTTVSISGGTFDMSKSTLNLWQNGSTLRLSGDAQFKVKGIIANGNTGRTVSVGGASKLILTGTLGLHSSLESVTLSGGTIELQESAEIRKVLTLAASTESTITVVKDKKAVLSGGTTGAGSLTLSGEGTVDNRAVLTCGDLTVCSDVVFDLSGFTGSAPVVNGTLSVEGGATVKLPAESTLPYRIASSGTWIVYDDVTVSIDGDASVTGPVRLSNGYLTTAVVYDLAGLTAEQLAAPMTIPAGVTAVFTNSSAYPDLVTYTGQITAEGGIVTLADVCFADLSFGSAGTLEVESGETRLAWTSENPMYSVSVNEDSALVIDASSVMLDEGDLRLARSVATGADNISVLLDDKDIGCTITPSGIVIGRGGYWRWAYADDIVTWTSSSVSDMGGAATFSLFDIETGSAADPAVTYTGNVVGHGDKLFWSTFCYVTSAEIGGVQRTPNYTAPGLVLRISADASYQKKIGGTFGPLTLGGLIVEEGANAQGYYFNNAKGDSGQLRTTILGDPTGVSEAWFVAKESIAFNGRVGDIALVGTNNFEVAAGKVLTIDPTSGYSLAMYATLDKAASGSKLGTPTPGGVLRLYGEGNLQFADARPLDARGGATLDYANLDTDPSTAFIQGGIIVDDTTKFAFPANAVFPYKVATNIVDLTTANGRNPYTVGGVAGTKKLVFDDATGEVYELEYANEATVAVNTAWSSLFTSPDYEKGFKVTVTESASLTIDSALSLKSLLIDVADGKTLTINSSGGSLSVVGCTFVVTSGTGGGSVQFDTALDYGRIAVEGEATVKTTAVPNLPKFRGTGTVKYYNIEFQNLSAATKSTMQRWAQSLMWSGTLWLADTYETPVTDFQPQLYGTASSYLKLTGFQGGFADANISCEVPIILEDDGEHPAFHVIHTHGGRTLTLSQLMGTGTLKETGTSSDSHNILVLDGSAFAGDLDIAQRTVAFGAAPSSWVVDGGMIYVAAGASVAAAAGSSWSAGQVTVNGTLLNRSDTPVEAPILTVGGTIEGKFNGGTAVNPGTLILNASVDATKVTLTNYKYLTVNTGVTQSDLSAQLGALATLTLNGSAHYTTVPTNEGIVTFGENSNATLTLHVDDAYIDYKGYTPIIAAGDGTVEYIYTGSTSGMTDHIRTSGYSLLPYFHIWATADDASAGDLNDSARWRADANQPVSATEQNPVNVAFNMTSSGLITVNVTGENVSYTVAQVFGEVNGTFSQRGSTVMALDKINLITGATLSLDESCGVTASAIYIEKGTTLKLGNGTWTNNITGYGTIVIPSGAMATMKASLPDTIKAIIVEEGGKLILNGTEASAGAPLAINPPVKAYGMVEAEGFVSFGSDANIFYDTSTFKIYAGSTVSGGTLQIDGGKVVGYGSGTATLDCDVNFREDSEVDIDAGLIVNANAGFSAADSDVLITKKGDGTLNVATTTSFAGNIKVVGGKMIVVALPAGNVAIEQGATFTLKDCDWTSGGDKFSGEGTLEFYTPTATRSISPQEISFGGVLKLVGTADGKRPNVGSNANTAQVFSGMPELVVVTAMSLDKNYNGRELLVRDFAGSGKIRMDQNASSSPTRTISTKQTKDTEFSGVFQWKSISDSNGTYSALKVYGDDHAAVVHSLTLSGANETTGSLTVSNNVKVVFTSVGKWDKGTVTVADGGWLQSSNPAAVASSLVLQDGAGIVRTTEPLTVTSIAAIDSSATIQVSVSDTSAPSGIYQIMDGAWASAPDAARFAFADSSFRGFGFYVQGSASGGRNSGLYICPATVTASNGTITPYASVSAAIDAVRSDSGYQYVTVYADAEVTKDLDDQNFKVKIADGVTFNVLSGANTHDVSMDRNETTGVYTYSLVESANLVFTWNGGAEGYWYATENWLVGGNAYSRPPTVSSDSVEFNSSAKVKMNGAAKVASVTVADGFTLTLAEDRALTTGSGSLVVTSTTGELVIENAAPYAGVAITAPAITVPVGSTFKDLNSDSVKVSGAVTTGTKLFTLSDATPEFSATKVSTCLGDIHYTKTGNDYIAGRTYWWKGSSISADGVSLLSDHEMWALDENLEQTATETPGVADTAIFNTSGKWAKVTGDIAYDIVVNDDTTFYMDVDSATTFDIGTITNGVGTVQETSLTIADGKTATLHVSKSSNLFNLKSMLLGSGTLACEEVGTGVSGSGVQFYGNTASFAGDVDLRLESATSYHRICDVAATTNSLSSWSISTTDAANNPFACAQGTTYKFGALNMCIGSQAVDAGTTGEQPVLEIGGLGKPSSISGAWGSGINPAISFLGGASETLTLSAANLTTLDVANGGTVVFGAAAGVPTTNLRFSNKSATLKTTDYASNPAGVSEFTVGSGLTVDVAENETWTWSGTPPTTSLAGGIVKTGKGELSITSASFAALGQVTTRAGRIVVNNGGVITYTLGSKTACEVSGTTYTFGPAVASVDGTMYLSLQAAITSAASGKTINLEADTAESVSFSGKKKIIIDRTSNEYTYNAPTLSGDGAYAMKTPVVSGTQTTYESVDAAASITRSDPAATYYFATIADAVNAAKSTDTIRLLTTASDYSVSGTFALSGAKFELLKQMNAGGTMNLSGSGTTLTLVKTGGNGNLQVASGTVNLTGGAMLTAKDAITLNASSIVNVDSASTVAADCNVVIGNAAGTAAVNLNGGTITVGDDIEIGKVKDSVGSMTVGGGALTIADSMVLGINNDTKGTYTQTGGTVAINGSAASSGLQVATSTSAEGVVEVTGGTLAAKQLMYGNSSSGGGTGKVTIGGDAVVTLTDGVKFGYSGNQNAKEELIVSGGRLRTGAVTVGSSQAAREGTSILLSGGVVEPLATSNDFIPSKVSVKLGAGGAILDVAGEKDITINGAVTKASGDFTPSVTKRGTGVVNVMSGPLPNGTVVTVEDSGQLVVAAGALWEGWVLGTNTAVSISGTTYTFVHIDDFVVAADESTSVTIPGPWVVMYNPGYADISEPDLLASTHPASTGYSYLACYAMGLLSRNRDNTVSASYPTLSEVGVTEDGGTVTAQYRLTGVTVPNGVTLGVTVKKSASADKSSAEAASVKTNIVGSEGGTDASATTINVTIGAERVAQYWLEISICGPEEQSSGE